MPIETTPDQEKSSQSLNNPYAAPQHGASAEVSSSVTPIAGPQLQKNVLGLLTTASLTAAYMGPALSIYALFGLISSKVGQGTGFVLIVGATLTMLSAVSFGLLAREMPSAGGVYTWGTKALGTTAGHFVGLTSMLSFLVNMIPVPLIFGQYCQRFFYQLFHDPAVPLSPAMGNFYFLLGVVVMMGFAASVVYRGIVVSSHLAFTLLMIECGVAMALGVTMAIFAYQNGTLSWTPMTLAACVNPVDPKIFGMSAVFLAIPMAFMCMTCDAAVPTGEETKNASWTIPVAVILTCFIVGIWYVFGFSAFSCAFQAPQMAGIQADDTTVMKMTQVVWGWLGILIPITAMTAALGAFIPGTTGASRALFAMSREGKAPSIFAYLYPKYVSPWNAFHMIFIVTFLGSVVPVMLYNIDTAMNFWGIILGWFIGFTYLVANLLNIVYFWRFARDRFNWILNGIVPIVAIAAQGYAIARGVFIDPIEDAATKTLGRNAQLVIVGIAVATLVYVLIKRNWSKNVPLSERLQ